MNRQGYQASRVRRILAAPVAWVYNKGITSGTSATIFNPNAACQRAQIITFMAQYFAE